ncbi:MAG: TetR/AcrR family transcriptional regulator [Polyangiaceae bacterium]|jgi:AcrR family transcriptional regulator
MARHRKSAGAYHHGDLRRALLDEALRFVERHGLEALSLRELARRLGVSPAAPYHHFADRTALLRELAQQGFVALLESAQRELEGETEPTRRLHAIGRGYVRFAIRHPWHYRVMFLPGNQLENDLATMTESPTFALLRECVIACLDQAGRGNVDPMPTILAMWGGVHGIVTLWFDGPLSRAVSHDEFEGMALAAVEVLNRAVMVPGDRKP